MNRNSRATKKVSYNILPRPSEQPYERMVKNSKPNQIKQIFILIGLVALVILIPILLISILNPETIFETRRQAAEDESYYGYIRNLTDLSELPPIGITEGFYLAALDGSWLDVDPSSTEKYVLSTEDLSSYVNNDLPDFLENVNGNIIGGTFYNLILLDDNSTVTEVGSNSIPTVTFTDIAGIEAYVGEEFAIKIDLADNDDVYGDYITNINLELIYSDGTPIDTWGMSIKPDILGSKFPQTTFIVGTPTEETTNMSVEVNVTDSLNAVSTTEVLTLSVTKRNSPPVINSINCVPSDVFTFQTGCPTNPTDSYDVTCTVDANDADNDTLSYTFENVPNEFVNPVIENNSLSFSVTKDDTPVGNYPFNIEVSDGVNDPVEQSKTISIQTEEVPCSTGQNPTAVFTAVPSTGSIPLTVTINPSSSSDPDGFIEQYKWTFGDGQHQTYNQGVTFNHTYDRSGVYTLTLEVIDNDGLSDSYSTTIQAGKNEEPQVVLLKPNIGTFSGSKVNPGNKIIWQVLDAEGDAPLHYEIDLLSATNIDSCDFNSLSGAKVYNLTSGNLAYDSSSELYYPTTFEWDTQSSLSGEIPDGKYCVMISVSDSTYGHFILDYSDNVIEIINAEHPPVITTDSLPEATKGITYSTQILAYDEDHDSLQFNLVYGPSWISINTGGKLFGQPTESGPFNIVVAVTDGKSERSRSYTLNVKATEGQVLPAVTLSASAEVFIGSDGKINWTMINDQDVSTVDLEYSIDGTEWLPITTGLPKDQNEYIWDVSDLEVGKYHIRLVYYDTQGNKLGASDVKELEIAKPETTRESFPNVFNFKPADSDNLSDTTPVIAANFSPSRGAKVDTNTISVYLNNELVNNKSGFEGFEGGFAYIPTEDLTPGEHTIKAGFKDTTGKIVDKKWSFTITSEDIAVVTPEGKKDFTKYLIAGGTIFVTAFLTILAYFLVKKINENKEQQETFAPKMFAQEKKDKDTQEFEKVMKEAKDTLEHTIKSKPLSIKKDGLLHSKQVKPKDILPPLPSKRVTTTTKPKSSKSKPKAGLKAKEAKELKLSDDDLPDNQESKDKSKEPKPIDALR